MAVEELTAQERTDLIRTVAEAALGHAGLREGQVEATQAAVADNDVLVVMPTGSGKSAIYQLAGALASGPVLVVSPLLALQRDQMAGIDGRLGGAVVLSSSLTDAQHREALDAPGTHRGLDTRPCQGCSKTRTRSTERCLRTLRHCGGLTLVTAAEC